MIWKATTVGVIVTLAVAVLVQSTVTKTQIYRISDVKITDSLGGTVAVQGKITYAYNNVFMLQDGTGKIEVDTCPTWYKRVELFPGDHVVVVGQVANNPSIDSKINFVLNAFKIMKGKETIVVRGRPGKPPWMYYRAPEAAPSS